MLQSDLTDQVHCWFYKPEKRKKNLIAAPGCSDRQAAIQVGVVNTRGGVSGGRRA